jgi:hypothetical protein
LSAFAQERRCAIGDSPLQQRTRNGTRTKYQKDVQYRAKVVRLAETFAEPEANGEAREDIRSLVGSGARATPSYAAT